MLLRSPLKLLLILCPPQGNSSVRLAANPLSASRQILCPPRGKSSVRLAANPLSTSRLSTYTADSRRSRPAASPCLPVRVGVSFTTRGSRDLSTYGGLSRSLDLSRTIAISRPIANSRDLSRVSQLSTYTADSHDPRYLTFTARVADSRCSTLTTRGPRGPRLAPRLVCPFGSESPSRPAALAISRVTSSE